MAAPPADSRPRMRRGLILLSLALAAAVVGGFLWAHFRWPSGEFKAELELKPPLKLDDPAIVVLRTNQDYERTRRLGVGAALDGLAMDVQSLGLENDGGHAVFRFKMTPRAVVHRRELLGTFSLRGHKVEQTKTETTVLMPLFYQDQEQSFLEMVSAPDASIYGSHITLWNELSDESELFLVTGHAASSVCRMASAALFGLGAETDVSSPYFVIGAGIGCIDVTGLKQEIESEKKAFLGNYPQIAEQLAATEKEAQADFEIRALLAGTSIEIEAADFELKWLENLDDTASRDVQPAVATSREDLQRLAAALGSIVAKTKSGTQGVDTLRREELELLSRFLANPQLVVAALTEEQAEEIEDSLVILRSWDAAKRETFRKALRKLVEKIKAFETANKNFDELRDRTGLVRKGRSTVNHRSDVDVIVKQVSSWAGQADGSRVIDLAALAAGHEGSVILPFFDAHGQPIEFTLNEAVLASAEGKSWREAVQNNASAELAAAAKEIHERVKKQLKDAQEQMERTAVPARYFERSGSPQMAEPRR